MSSLPNDQDKTIEGLISVINKLILMIVVLVIGIIAMPFVLLNSKKTKSVSKEQPQAIVKDTTSYWTAADINSISDSVKKLQVVYGQELIAHTSVFLGPKGKVATISNGLNCQNCHLQAGTVIWGNNYGSVASLYPKFRVRSGTIENVYKRVNDCFERSLNGKALDTNGKEMQAIAAYINFIGSNVPKGKKAAGSGFKDLSYLDRAADPQNGATVYQAKCQSCHQANGEGVFNAEKTEYIYPAMWGSNSFNDAAGLFRIGNFAKYVKYNMPLGASYLNTQLTDEEAWDVAAYVLSQPRPHKNTPNDWPDLSKKPVDHPFGPYADIFTERQHKYGPFKPIIETQKKKEETVDKKVIAVVK